MSDHSSSTVTVGDVARALDTIAPPALAQSWDNVGLLVGDRSASCGRVLLCIDLTPAVLDEATKHRAALVMAYHPVLFKPVVRILADSSGTDALVHRAIAAGIAIHSPHTALDAAEGGANDVLASLCDLDAVEPFEYVSTGPKQYKLVTFVPPRDLEEVAQVVFAAGAGHIGEYSQCSYRTQGEGTFFGSEETNPQVGRCGRLEKVAEMRIEVVVPDRCLPEVIAALRSSHPYEEPAFDLYPLAGEPLKGIGRVGTLPDGMTLGALADRLTSSTESKVTMIVGDRERPVRRAAVCVGAAGRLPLESRRSADCDVIVTGEIRHHDALTVLRNDRTAIALGHWESERPMLKSLAQRLGHALPGVEMIISTADRGPLQR